MFDLPPPDPAYEFVLSSRGMSKGIAQTEEPQVISKGSLQVGPLETGAQWKNVTSSSAAGEGAVFLNASRTVGRVRLSGGAAYKFQTGVTGPSDTGSWEFNAGVSPKLGKLTIRLNGIYSPNDLGSAGRSLYFEGGPSYELDAATRLSANIGHRERDLSPDYTAFNLGVSRIFARKLTVDLRYYDTAQSDIDTPYKARVVLSGRLQF